jgi:putative transcriptional regulator
MTIKHHPSEETLLRYAAGTLGAGPALVIAVHVEGCELCRTRIAEFESVGGMVLEDMPIEHMATDALARTLEQLDVVASSPMKRPTIARNHRREIGIELPPPLYHCEIGPWRWLGPGFRWSKVTIPGNPDAKVMLLKGRAGLKLPAHGHTGAEFMQVLSGSLFDQRGRYCAGDLDEAGADIDHQPTVDPETECICLAALEGDTRLHGLLGRLLRPLVGF